MTDTDSRVRECFRAVFPDLPEAELSTASPETVSDWDSLHALLLVAVLEETFAIRIPVRDYPSLRSFPEVRDYVDRAG
jgi:acyl carrier protein